MLCCFMLRELIKIAVCTVINIRGKQKQQTTPIHLTAFCNTNTIYIYSITVLLSV